jgi:uncharacterized damage-inducible protein DinB
MYQTIRRFAVTALIAGCCAKPAVSQDVKPEPDAIIGSMQLGAQHIRAMYTQAVAQMSEADFAFKPTPEVRSFGQLIAHVAETNYYFCANALGEKLPVSNIEKTVTARADLTKALEASFVYCERAFAAINDPVHAKRTASFREHPVTAGALLNFRNYHSLLHWGNAITYMRLRGKVPPTAG